MRPGIVRDEFFNQQELGVPRRCLANRTENGNGFLVIPVVYHLHHQIGIADRQCILEKITGLQRETL